MNYLRPTALVLVWSALLVPLPAGAIAQEPASSKTGDAKIRQLQQRRVDILQRAVEMAFAQYRAGVAGFDIVHSMQHDLLDARLEMARSVAERIKLLTFQLEIAQSALAYTKAKFEAADTSALDVHRAESAALRIEIQLLKLKQAEAKKKSR